MHQYRMLVRLPNGTTTRIQIVAEGDNAARQIGIATYGEGNVLHYTRVGL